MKPSVLILGSVALGAVAQLSMKQGMLVLGPITNLSLGTLLRIFLQPMVLVGLLCYAVAAVSWLVVLSRVPLSLAYPMLSLGYVIVVLASALLFREPTSIVKALALLLICAGVLLLGSQG